eukprot:gnl/Carplike_NY0171/13993_a20557_107.p1 GENE.gnl/Carplike_NY0171/13993_a20557_107~~gnl/Carplike_NY0171/13993_a20557_107.p1  ORF type:complete len:294 (-),score=103.63 gnl/Carplike_NY0171/13993_a20557_107:22-876(-)
MSEQERMFGDDFHPLSGHSYEDSASFEANKILTDTRFEMSVRNDRQRRYEYEQLYQRRCKENELTIRALDAERREERLRESERAPIFGIDTDIPAYSEEEQSKHLEYLLSDDECETATITDDERLITFSFKYEVSVAGESKDDSHVQEGDFEISLANKVNINALIEYMQIHYPFIIPADISNIEKHCYNLVREEAGWSVGDRIHGFCVEYNGKNDAEDELSGWDECPPRVKASTYNPSPHSNISMGHTSTLDSEQIVLDDLYGGHVQMEEEEEEDEEEEEEEEE